MYFFPPLSHTLDVIMPLDFSKTKIRFCLNLILTLCKCHMIVIDETLELIDVRQIEAMQNR